MAEKEKEKLPISGHQAQVERGTEQQLQSQKAYSGPCHSQVVSVQGNILPAYASQHPPRKQF